MTDVKEALARLRKWINRYDEEVPVGDVPERVEWTRTVLDHLEAVERELAAERDEVELKKACINGMREQTDALRERLESAEKVIAASEARLKVWTRETFMELLGAIDDYHARFGARDE